jgi:hypothetical protein
MNQGDPGVETRSIRNEQDFEQIARILAAIDREVIKLGGWLSAEIKTTRSFDLEFLDVAVSFRVNSIGWREYREARLFGNTPNPPDGSEKHEEAQA